MLDVGIQKSKVAKVSGRSLTTIKYIDQKDTIEKYKDLVSGISARNKARRRKEKSGIKLSVKETDLEVSVPNLLRKIADYLEKNSNK